MTEEKPPELPDWPELKTQPKFNWDLSIKLYMRRQQIKENKPQHILDDA